MYCQNPTWAKPVAFLLFALLGADLVSAQSTVIQSGGQNEGAIQIPQENFGGVPNSLNREQRAWFNKLAKPHPGYFQNVNYAHELIEKLRELGLPIELDDTASDDSFTENEAIQIDLPNRPLNDLLANCLDRHNATLAMLGNRLLIISKDVAGDPEFFTTITYEVTAVGSDGFGLLENVKSLIAPDEWDDTNGDGVLEVIERGGRQYLGVSQTFQAHHQIQRYLVGQLRLQGPSSMIARSSNSAGFMESQVINLPSPYQQRNRGEWGGRGGGFGGGGGIGGYGLGGGIF